MCIAVCKWDLAALFNQAAVLVSSASTDVLYGEESMKAYYSCIIGCNSTDDLTCLNNCANNTLNVTLVALASTISNAKPASYSLCEYSDLDCIFTYGYSFEYTEEEVYTYYACQEECSNSI